MRIVSGMMLAAVLGIAPGCGKSEPAGEANQPLPEAPTTTTPIGEPPRVAPSAGWEMDPTKHAIPTSAVSGKLRGEDVTLDVQAEKDCLRFRVIKSGTPVNAIEIRFKDPMKAIEGLAATVKPDQPDAPELPVVIVSNPSNAAEIPKILNNGYSLTLNVGKREKGKLSGKVFLSLADEQKSFVAGTFTADWIRATTEQPGADDMPFIHGKLTIAGVNDPNVWIGFVRVDPYDAAKGPSSDVVGTELRAGASYVRSDNVRPMALLVPGANPSKDAARYELTKLEPGRYWVFATVKGGPAAWKWVTIEPGSQLSLDLAIEAGTFGSIDVTAPGTTESIALVPAGEPGKPWPEALVNSAASIADLFVSTAANKPDPAKPLNVKYPRLAPGKYEVWAGDVKVDVEVKANETAKVELKKK